MRISIPGKELREALIAVSSVVPGNPGLPILGAVRISAADGGCEVAAVWSYTVKCVDGAYPNYRRVIPNGKRRGGARLDSSGRGKCRSSNAHRFHVHSGDEYERKISARGFPVGRSVLARPFRSCLGAFVVD